MHLAAVRGKSRYRHLRPASCSADKWLAVAVSPPPVQFPSRYAPTVQRRDAGSESGSRKRQSRKGADHVALGRGGSTASHDTRDCNRTNSFAHIHNIVSLVDIDRHACRRKVIEPVGILDPAKLCSIAAIDELANHALNMDYRNRAAATSDDLKDLLSILVNRRRADIRHAGLKNSPCHAATPFFSSPL